MELIQIKDPDFKTLEEIVKIEQDSFEGNGNVDLWIIKALVRYGLVFIIKEDNKIISIVEYMQSFNQKSVFLYGISTLKEYRFKGYASFLLEKTEEYLKKLDYSSIELTVDPKNEVAIRLYKNHGYTKIKFLKDEYGTGIDRNVMRKDI